MSLGVEPQTACDLAECLAKAPNLGGAQLPPPPLATSAKPDAAAAASSNPESNKDRDPPKKKPKAPRPEAGSK